MPPHLKKSINQAHLENGTYEQILSPLERELELNGLEAPDEMPINTATQQAPQQNAEKRKPTCHHCKKRGHYQNQCRQLKREKTKPEQMRIVPTIKMVVPKRTLTPATKFRTKLKRILQIIKETEDLDLSSHPVRPVVELTTPQRNATLEQTQQTDRLPKKTTARTKPSPTGKWSKQLKWQCPICSPNFKIATPRLHSGIASDRPETNEIQNFH